MDFAAHRLLFPVSPRKFVAAAKLPGIAIDPASVESNIVIFDVSGTGKTPGAISAGLKTQGVLMNGINDRLVRAVTHYDVSRADCAHAAQVLASII